MNPERRTADPVVSLSISLDPNAQGLAPSLPLPNGIVVVNKPAGMSSNGVLNRLKEALAARPGAPKGKAGRVKMGFLGTLDPMATGVLPVFLGKATGLISLFEGLDKEYRVGLELGVETDTHDLEGAVTARHDPSGVTAQALGAALARYQGEMIQATPAYSAVKTDGVPAYKRARRGETPPPKTRTIRLTAPQLEDISLPRAVFRVGCSSGTYMRVLVHDLGRDLGVGAAAFLIQRLRVGALFLLEKSYTLDTLTSMLREGRFQAVESPVGFLKPSGFQALTLDGPMEQKIRQGARVEIPPGLLSDPNRLPVERQPWMALRPDGTLVAVGVAVRIETTGNTGMPLKASGEFQNESSSELLNTGWAFQPQRVLVE
ncbi:MAG: tRNA pseudouridine(55) synthase TruB [Deltaproteobacteria bacterium]|nr:tRNA pseudouridine(55) synthase TruB [Deltaproteobacteria bacterium]